VNDKIIGIDLGTTNSEVAVVVNDQVVVIADENGDRIIPSVVALNDKNELLIGREAKNQYALYPEKTIASIKRHMGLEEAISLGDKTYSPPEISAMILKKLKRIAENYLGQAVQKAVITVPAFFSDKQRQATRLAGELAGLDVVRIINEPTAAAMAYEGTQNAKKILVYDFGGGTFDVSVVSMTESVVEVIASHGNNHLGGDDFDKKITEFLKNHVYETYQFNADKDTKVIARLKQAAEKAKIHLSDNSYCQIQEEYLFVQEGNPVHMSLEITRPDYEDMITGYIDETFECIHIALRDANLTAKDIDEILLVGGTTRTPLIQQRLEEKFNKQPRADIHPDLCVAMGAAIQAGMINGDQTAKILVDVTPYTFGTEALGMLHDEFSPHVFCPLIKKNTPIPVTKSQSFMKMSDEQTSVQIGVYQGEDPDARNNTMIGEFLFDNLSSKQGSEEIVAQFHLDINGILQVTAVEKKTGESRSITIANALTTSPEEQLALSQKRIDDLFDDVPIVSDNQYQTHAQSALKRAESLLEKVEGEDSSDLINLMENVRDNLHAADVRLLETAVTELTDLMYFLELSPA
jgi:molecular chaperone DnaK